METKTPERTTVWNGEMWCVVLGGTAIILLMFAIAIPTSSKQTTVLHKWQKNVQLERFEVDRFTEYEVPVGATVVFKERLPKTKKTYWYKPNAIRDGKKSEYDYKVAENNITQDRFYTLTLYDGALMYTYEMKAWVAQSQWAKAETLDRSAPAWPSKLPDDLDPEYKWRLGEKVEMFVTDLVDDKGNILLTKEHAREEWIDMPDKYTIGYNMFGGAVAYPWN